MTPELHEQPTEEVVVLLKPGAVEYEDRFNEFAREHGFTIESRQEQVFDEETIRRFYPHAEGQYIEGMTDYFLREPTVALVVKGNGVLATCMRLKRHVRGILKLGHPETGLHSSDSADEATREKDALGL